MRPSHKHTGSPRAEQMAEESPLPIFASVAKDVRMGPRVRLAPFVNLYGCEIGADTRLGAFVEIQRDAVVGRRCKVSSHTFICSGVVVEDEVFIGHGVVFINDRDPRATNGDGTPKADSDWRMERTVVRRGASIGSGSTILCGIEIGERAMVGAGAVVTRNVPAGVVVVGNPARAIRSERSIGDAGPSTRGTST
jgi:UDP-2-acetamido-3-amino-2,3-dideoxy-glucuronate N-acetyltransferase